MVLFMQELQGNPEAKARGLLRFLFLRLGAMSVEARAGRLLLTGAVIPAVSLVDFVRIVRVQTPTPRIHPSSASTCSPVIRSPSLLIRHTTSLA